MLVKDSKHEKCAAKWEHRYMALIRSRKSIVATALFLAAVGLSITLASCTAQQSAVRTDQQQQTTSDMHQISELVHRISHDHNLSHRRPAQQRRADAMKQLARHADTMLASTQDWESAPQLASLGGTSSPTQQKVVEFRSALASVRESAARKNEIELAQNYRQLQHSYRELLAQTGADKTR